MQLLVYLGAVVVTVLLSLGNIGLKTIAVPLGQALVDLRLLNFAPLISLLPRVVAVGCIYALGTVLWMWVLSHLALNRAFLFVSLTFVFVPLFSHLLLGEQIGTGVWVGTPLIVLGILLATML